MSRATPGEPPLHLQQQRGADAGALSLGIDRHPVQIVGAEGAGGRAPADPADETAVQLRTEHVIGVGWMAAHRLVEDLERDRDLIFAEQSYRPGDLLDAVPVGCE